MLLKLAAAEQEGAISRAADDLKAIWAQRDRILGLLADAGQLHARGVRVRFTSTTGAGASALLNGLLGAWLASPSQPLPDEEPSDCLQRTAVIPLGAGHTTPCEVNFQFSTSWSVTVQRADDHEAHKAVEELAIWATDTARIAGGRTATGGQRAHHRLARLCGLTMEELRQKAVALADQPDPTTALIGELTNSLNHQQRGSFVARPGRDDDPKQWLKSLLNALAEGSRRGQPVLSRIVVRAPIVPRFTEGSTPLHLIDSPGIGSQACSRAHPNPLDHKGANPPNREPWTVVVYVAGFTNPPEPVGPLLTEAMLCRSPLIKPEHAVVSVVYRSEAILIDKSAEPSPAMQRSEAAEAKREAATAGINALLRQGSVNWRWSEDQTPVVDLSGRLDAGHSVVGLMRAIDARLDDIGRRWHADLEQAVDALWDRL